MNCENIDVTRKCPVVICAVLFGCDDSIIGLDLGEGIKITRKTQNEINELNEIFEVINNGFNNQYVDALLDPKYDVACIYSSYEFIGDAHAANLHYLHKSSQMYTYLDNQLKAIRLMLEGPISYRKLVFKVISEHTIYKSIIGEANNIWTTNKVHCENIEQLNIEMNKISFPLSEKYMDQAHMLYDRSYFVTMQEAEVLLVTSLEVLFLDSENSKKERLSRRCATFIFDNQRDRVDTYKKLCLEYKKRSDYVHDGDSSGISEEDIIFLRECVRRSILKLIKSPIDKSGLIKNLKEKIQELDYWK